jgi:hypothetical protein
MVQIFTAEQLAAVWGLVSLDPSPLDALGREDVVLSEGLRRRLDVPIAKRRPPRERAALLDRLMEPRVGLLPQRLSFGIRPAVGRSAARSLPKGEYDVVVALRIDVINQVLAGLFETHAWQNSIPVAEVEEQLSLGALRAFSDDIPDVDGLKVGALRLSRPATVSVDSERRILASQSLVLDLITTNEFPPTVVTSLEATVTLPVRLATRQDVDDPELMAIVWVTDEGHLGVDAEASSLEVSPESPIQPRNDQTLGLFTIALAILLLHALGQQELTFSPTIRVPLSALGGEVSLRLQRADLRAARRRGGDALMLGILIGRDPEPEPGTGSPTAIDVSPFSSTSPGNVVLRVHEALLNKLAAEAVPLVEQTVRAKIKAILDDVNLGEFAAEIANFNVDSINIDLRPINNMRVTTDATFEDFCGPGPANLFDLDFDATADIQVGASGGVLEYIRPKEVDVNFSDSDLVVCAITGQFDLATGLFATEILSNTAIIVGISLNTGTTDPIFGRLRSLFDFDRPVPGTELLPTVNIVQTRVDSREVELVGRLDLGQDNVHTFIYARVGGDPLSGPPPLPAHLVKDALVEVIDQDVPPPKSDDIRIPKEGTTTKTIGKREITTTVEYLPPFSDDVLARGRTDDKGLVRDQRLGAGPGALRGPVVIDRASRGGAVRVTRSEERTDIPNPVPQVTETTTPLNERRPDVFFRVTLKDGRVFDSRTTTDRLFLAVNLDDRRIGSPAAPLLLAVPPPIPGGEHER